MCGPDLAIGANGETFLAGVSFLRLTGEAEPFQCGLHGDDGRATTMGRFAIPLGLCLLAGGCAEFGYTSATYVGLRPQVVTIGCKDPYEVYDQRQKRLMLIVSNGLREYAGCGLDGVDPAATYAARMREAARTYLDETVREDCTITRETPLAPLRTEFAYSCAAPIEKPGTKVPRLPGRY